MFHFRSIIGNRQNILCDNTTGTTNNNCSEIKLVLQCLVQSNYVFQSLWIHLIKGGITEKWRLKVRGVMSYAVSLQMQCYMFIVGHLDELPSDVIALLPIGIRRKLLLMLPALDICKLEETPVTDGISMDDEIWKLKCDSEQRFKFGNITLSWKDSYFCGMSWGELPVDTCMLLPNICIPPAEYKCTGNIQGLHFANSHRAVVPDRYKIYYDTYRPQYCVSELLKVLADSNISFKAIDLETFLRNFVGFEIPVECVPLLEKLLNFVIALEIFQYGDHDVPVDVAEKLLSIINFLLILSVKSNILLSLIVI